MASQRHQVLAAVRTQLEAITAAPFEIVVAQVRPWLIQPAETPHGLGDSWWVGYRAEASVATYSHGQVEWRMPLTVVLARTRAMGAWTNAEHDDGTSIEWMLEQASRALDAAKAALAGPATHRLGGYAIMTEVVSVYDESGMSPAALRESSSAGDRMVVFAVAKFSIRYHEPQGVTS